MATPSVMQGDFIFQGQVSIGGGIALPLASVGNDQMSLSDPVSASKLDHRYLPRHSQPAGTDVVAETSVPLHLSLQGGTIVGAMVRAETPPAGGDLAYTVDILKAADGSGAYASIFSSPILVDQAALANQTILGVLATTLFNALDNFIMNVAVSGSTGTQGQGFTAELIIDEES